MPWELDAPEISGLFPVTWEEAKAHLRLTTDDDQAYVESLIDAATDYAETRLATSLMQQTRTENFYTHQPTIVIPRGPLISVTSATDANGVIAPAAYSVSQVGNSVRLTFTGTWKPTLTVVYQAGYASAVAIPASIKLAILTHVATLYENRESVAEKSMLPVPHTLEDFYRLKSRSVGVG